MAEDKKSFVLYADQIHTVNLLTDEQAGKLYKHLLAYVSDLDPKTDDPIVNIAFEPIKRQLKRDLEKWGETRGKRAEAGRAGGLKRAENVKQKQAMLEASKPDQANQAVNATVTVTVNDTVINIREELLNSQGWIDKVSMTKKRKDVKDKLTEFLNNQELSNGLDRDLNDVKSHFVNWLVKQPKQPTNSTGSLRFAT